MAERIPPELLHEIFSFAYPDIFQPSDPNLWWTQFNHSIGGRQRALSSLSLVCQSWKYPARRIALKSVRIYFSRKQVNGLLLTLKDNRNRAFLKSLVVDFPFRQDSMPDLIACSHINTIIRVADSLVGLHLDNTPQSLVLNGNLDMAFQSLPGQSALRHFGLRFLGTNCDGHFPGVHLSRFPNLPPSLESLALCAIDLSNSATVKGVQQLVNLQDLYLEDLRCPAPIWRDVFSQISLSSISVVECSLPPHFYEDIAQIYPTLQKLAFLSGRDEEGPRLCDSDRMPVDQRNIVMEDLGENLTDSMSYSSPMPPAPCVLVTFPIPAELMIEFCHRSGTPVQGTTLTSCVGSMMNNEFTERLSQIAQVPVKVRITKDWFSEEDEIGMEGIIYVCAGMKTMQRETHISKIELDQWDMQEAIDGLERVKRYFEVTEEVEQMLFC
ncbi:hypothetical protein BT69DRAFT_1289168 [Atractiella rhizophila]|nr:hypothetical protein BT69DRAFT_1289168 [Atractiella rhizophila]